MTLGDIDVGKLDGLHSSGAPQGDEFAAEEARLLDELLASADLSSPDTPEVRPVHQLSDDDQWQGTSSAREQSQQPTLVVVPPFTNAVINGDSSLTDRTLPVEANEPSVLGRDAIDADAESAAEEDKQPGRRPISVDLSWLDKLDGRAPGPMSGAETPSVHEQTTLASTEERPLEHTVVVPPFTYSAPTTDLASVDTTALSEKFDVHEVEVLHEETTPGAGVAEIAAEEAMPGAGVAEIAAEEAMPADECLATAEISAPDAPEANSDAQETLSSAPELPFGQATTVTPDVVITPSPDPAFTGQAGLGETTESRRRTSRAILAVLAAALLVTTLGAGFVAVKQHDSSLQWRQRDQEAAALTASLVTRNGELSRNLANVNGSVTSLNSQTSRLNNEIKSLQTQLSAAKQAQVKTFGRSVLGQLTKEAGSVSSGLAMCVNDMNSLRTEINRDISNLRSPDPHLQPNTQNTDAWCATARQDNQQLQLTLSKAR